MFGFGRHRRHHHPYRAGEECASYPRGCFPLSAASAGERLRLVSIEGGHMLRLRLAELGLNPGSELRVVQHQPGGPLILAVKQDARMAIGRGMAHKIIVTEDESA